MGVTPQMKSTVMETVVTGEPYVGSDAPFLKSDKRLCEFEG